jgi:hypothetical protein
MSQASLPHTAALLTVPPPGTRQARWFAAIAVALIAVSALLAGWAPIGFSIVTVFLFAGPHNWFEFRYFLTRMPARWGPRRTFFLLGILGAFGLTALFLAYTWIGLALGFSHNTWLNVSAAWNTALAVWIAAMLHLRGRERPDRDWSWCWMLAFLAASAGWLAPMEFAVALVYLHPLIALVFLDREIQRRRPAWRRTYRAVLLLVPVTLAILWWRLADRPNLPGDDALSIRITRHAGEGIATFASTHLLVAAHTFLEMLHYSVWLLAIPLVSLGGAPWNIATTPLAKKSQAFRLLVMGIVIGGAALVLIFWAGFLADYPRTRDIYFSIAMLHVLAEAPFLIRSMS